jgi:hypothetical protein
LRNTPFVSDGLREECLMWLSRVDGVTVFGTRGVANEQ